jgi:hypothetical protein
LSTSACVSINSDLPLEFVYLVTQIIHLSLRIRMIRFDLSEMSSLTKLTHTSRATCTCVFGVSGVVRPRRALHRADSPHPARHNLDRFLLGSLFEAVSRSHIHILSCTCGLSLPLSSFYSGYFYLSFFLLTFLNKLC